MGKLKSCAELTNIIKDTEAALEVATDKKDRQRMKKKIEKAKKDLQTLISEDNTGYKHRE